MHNTHLHFHLSHYIFLAVVLGFGAVFFIINSGNPFIQSRIVIAESLFYFLWGIWHHRLEGDLHPKVVVEYLLVSLLALILLRGAFLR